MKQTFEQFLEEKCPAELQTNNDPAGFERWVEQLDVQEVIDLAEEWGRKIAFDNMMGNPIDQLNKLKIR